MGELREIEGINNLAENPFADIGKQEQNEDPDRLLGLEGVIKLMGLWKRPPAARWSDRLNFVASNSMRLSEILDRSSLSPFAKSYLSDIANISWMQGISPEQIMRLKGMGMKSALKEVFSSKEPSLGLEHFLLGSYIRNIPNLGYFGTPDFLGSVAINWNEWIANAGAIVK